MTTIESTDPERANIIRSDSPPPNYQATEDQDISRKTGLAQRRAQEEKKKKGIPKTKNRGWTWSLAFHVFTCFCGTMIPMGFYMGVGGDAATFVEDFIHSSYRSQYATITKFGTRRNVDIGSMYHLYQITIALFSIGGICGALLTPLLANNLGRKWAMFANNFFGVAGAVMVIICSIKDIDKFQLLMGGRFVLGIYCGLGSTLGPLYICEIAPKKMRGGLLVMCQLMVAIMIVVAYILSTSDFLGTRDTWNYLYGGAVIGTVLQIILLPCCTETPRHLAVHHNDNHAAQWALLKLGAKVRHADDEVIEMHEERRHLQSRRDAGTCKDPAWRNPLILSAIMLAAQEFSGSDVVMVYSKSIFKKAFDSETITQYSTEFMGVAIVLVTIMTVFAVDTFGRKKMMLTAGFVALFNLGLMAVWVMLDSTDDVIDYIAAMAVGLFIAGWSLGPGPMPWVLTFEYFQHAGRAKAVGIAVAFWWLAQGTESLCFSYIKSELGDFVFIPYFVTLLVLMLICILFMIETKMKTFNEIADMFLYEKDHDEEEHEN